MQERLFIPSEGFRQNSVRVCLAAGLKRGGGSGGAHKSGETHSASMFGALDERWVSIFVRVIQKRLDRTKLPGWMHVVANRKIGRP
jgi:hypothetical protein